VYVPYLTHRILLVLHCLSSLTTSSHSFRCEISVEAKHTAISCVLIRLYIVCCTPYRFIQSEVMLGGWVFPTAGLDATWKEENISPLPGIEPPSYCHSLDSRRYTDWAISAVWGTLYSVILKSHFGDKTGISSPASLFQKDKQYKSIMCLPAAAGYLPTGLRTQVSRLVCG
jgi:hypothetical protein